MSHTGSRQHEEFSISETRKRVVRQDRFNTEELNCWLECGSRRYKVTDLSAFGVAFTSDTDIAVGEDMATGTLYLNDVAFADVSIRVARCTKTEEGYRIGVENFGEPISLSSAIAVRDAFTLIQKEEAALTRTSLVPTSFRLKVLELKDWLEALQTTVNNQSRNVKKDDSLVSGDYESAYAEVVGAFIQKVMPVLNNDLRVLMPDNDPEILKASIEFLREKLFHLIYQAPFADRTFSKPLGYAGDYEMMNIIYGESTVGDSLFAKCLNHYWVMQPAAQAVRNRANYLIRNIGATFQTPSKEPKKFLSVACGPAMEWQRMIHEVRKFNDATASVHLLDQDEVALKHAQRQMKVHSQKNPNGFEFTFFNRAIKNVITRGLEEDGYDLIYSAGLFDYFSEPVAQMAAKKMYDGLKPGGKLIIGNFNISNPSSMIMHLALDWHLVYRSEADLLRLFSPIGGKIHIEKEDLDINLFCVIEKEA